MANASIRHAVPSPLHDLAWIVECVRRDGPTRVVVSDTGYAVAEEKARRDYRVQWDVAFVRSDGWTVGASDMLASVARSLFPSDWIGVVRRVPG